MTKLTIRKIVLIIIFISVLVAQALLFEKLHSLNHAQYPVSGTIDEVLKPNQSLVYSNLATNNYIEAGINFNEYLLSTNLKFLKKYAISLDSMCIYLDSLNILSKKDENFSRIINAEKSAGNQVITFRRELDALMNKKINTVGKTKPIDFDIKKYNYEKIISSITFDTVKKVTEKKKKSLFGRIGNALSGKTTTDKEVTQTTITMVFNNRETTGTFQEQLRNTFKLNETFYTNHFNQLKKTYLVLKQKDIKLLQINKIIFKKSKSILLFYTKSAQKASLLNYTNAAKKYDRQITEQKNEIKLLLIATVIATVLLLLYTIYAYFSEINLAKAKGTSDLNLEKKNQLIGMLSHEMRAPLNIIANFSEKLKIQNSNHDLTPAINSINFASNSLESIVSQILDFIKNENNQLNLYGSRINLKNEILSVVESLKTLSEVKSIKIITNIDHNIDTEVWADRVKIHQLFYNLIVNAIKFTNDGSITVNTKLTKLDDKHRLDVSIIDTGIGIAEEDVKNIFDKFFQSKNHNDQIHFGAGLGLNICKTIIELHQGELNVESKLNKGTKISFFILLEEIKSKLDTLQTELESKFKDKKIKIAIVDDDPITLNILKNLTSTLGFEAITFERAPQVLHYLNQEIVHAIITDIQIFDYSGIALLKDIKKLNNANNRIPILALTGDSYLSATKDLSLGFDEILQKPIHREEFFQKLLSVL
jgi:signal transduction histidine kinase/CheY-like chemotaxis protein